MATRFGATADPHDHRDLWWGADDDPDDVGDVVFLRGDDFAVEVALERSQWPGEGVDPFSRAVDMIGWHQDLSWGSGGSILPTKSDVAFVRKTVPQIELFELRLYERLIRLVPGFIASPDSLGDPPSDPLGEQFRELAERWRNETGMLSSVDRMSMHPAYQRIIGLGPDVIPYILEDLRHAPDHWFWALVALTGADPAAGEDSMQAAAQAWIDWGVAKGYLPER